MKRTIITACAFVLLMEQAYADFAEWTRNNRTQPAAEQATPKPESTVKEKEEASPAAVKTNPAPVRTAPTPILTAPPKAAPVIQAEQPRPIAPRPVTPASTYSAPATGAGINPDHLTSYIKNSVALVNNDRNKKMEPKHFLALNMLNGVLIATAAEIMENGKAISGGKEIANAIGCINSYKSSELFAQAQQVLNKHREVPGLGGVIDSTPKIGSGHIAKCG